MKAIFPNCILILIYNKISTFFTFFQKHIDVAHCPIGKYNTSEILLYNHETLSKYDTILINFVIEEFF